MTTKKNSVNNAKNNSENKNNVNNVKCFIDNANSVLKSVGKDLRDGNKENFSLSRVLKDMQRSALLDAGYRSVFLAVGIDVNKGKVDAKLFFSKLNSEQSAKDKKGNTYFGIWGYSIERDENGNEINRTKVLRKVTSWSPNKVFKMLAQANELNKENAK